MKLEREKIFNTIGFLLLAGCFAYSLIKVTTRTARENDESIITIRFAHWQLEAGIKDALDAVAREYTKKHPNVRIEQILIPERTYPTWLTTRLVGGNPPDLISIGTSHGMTEERMARYFVPLTTEIEKPNPYNDGGPLQGLAWRDTFLDGLASSPGIQNLFDYYGVPSSVTTIRLFYNEPLYQKIMGKSTPPATYNELKEVFASVQAYNKKHHSNIVPIAGSKYNAPLMMDALFSIQTQKLMLKLDRSKTLRAPTSPFVPYFDGSVSLDDPSILSALALSREIGQHMPQGFMQLAREDSTFSFVQQKSLMIATGSWDVTSLRQEAPFQVAVIRIPLPLTSDPDYGPYLLGPPAESEVGTSVNFGLARDSANPETALDFLKFLTSQKGNSLFCETSKWLPSVVGVPVPESVKPFEPVPEGYPAGFGIKTSGGSEVQRIYENAFYRLVKPDGSVQAFMEYFKPLYPAALTHDGKMNIKNSLRNISRQDTTLTALRHLAGEGDLRSSEKAATLQEVQSTIEMSYYGNRYAIWNFENKKGN